MWYVCKPIVSNINSHNFPNNSTVSSHFIRNSIYNIQSLQITSEPCSSDRDSYSVPCARDYDIAAVCGESIKAAPEPVSDL